MVLAAAVARACLSKSAMDLGSLIVLSAIARFEGVMLARELLWSVSSKSSKLEDGGDGLGGRGEELISSALSMLTTTFSKWSSTRWFDPLGSGLGVDKSCDVLRS
jgi:hypothetical protein